MNNPKKKQLNKTVHLSGRAKIKLENLLEYLEAERSSELKNNFIHKLIIQSNPEIFPKNRGN